MLKYGRLALADALSGTSGQVAAPHVDRDAEADAAVADDARRRRSTGRPPRRRQPARARRPSAGRAGGIRRSHR